ncbi:isopentenyl phosphate kinase family protein [Oscillochloris sp. ZM17-4]|uniref:isopentenyl phosphate kinase n=1 Tax=Oscillochloris sp. ZM17-4 TaxID=2866714 RepID=UPI001C73272C|nr:isopentenyl phosphate kinase [Oscillochloris sp. ZM17-4]MBX0327604.1 isopentenyl phosphate kinase family protein [Oscillochloris sp. ZM17-4]
MYTFIKLGGSVITHKAGREVADLPVITRLAGEIARARADSPDLRLIISHGSGSFGHHYAAQYGVHRGLAADADWMGFALTAGAALRLNRIVVDALLAANLPAVEIQPSAALRSAAGQVIAWDTAPVGVALSHSLIPVIHGDVAFDSQQGSAIISTEQLLAHLALATDLRPARVVLVGEDAVYTADPRIDMNAERIPLITADNIDAVLHGAVGSHAVDVTGGMRSKLDLMWRLVQSVPGLEVRLVGPAPGLLAAALGDGQIDFGTIIRAS